ncbi:hypothetical protein ACHAW6_005311 [Cyclotella cf. meneghiniana]
MARAQGRMVQQESTMGLSFAELREIDCYGCGKRGHPWRRCPELTQDMKDAVVAKLKEGSSAKDAIKEAISNINVGSDEAAQECIDGVTNLNVQGADEASIQSMDYQEMDSDDGTMDSVNCNVIAYASKSRAGICNKNRAYLDTGATQHSCCNVDLLQRRHVTKTTLRQHCNAGMKLTNRMGNIGPFKFWENPDGIANLLSFALLEKQGYEFIYKTGGGWMAYMPDGGQIYFKMDTGVCDRMPYVDLTDLDAHITYPTDSLVMIETVRGNLEGFTLEEVSRAKKARLALAMMGHPTEKTLIKMRGQLGEARQPG